jgi:hypothetical protein
MAIHLQNWSKFWLVSFGALLWLPLNLPVFAEPKLLSIHLDTQGNQNFTTSIQQAELLVSKSIDQEFNRLSTVTEIEITVVGERNGQEVPLLSTKVTRQDWQAQPKIQLWTNYFTKAEILLGFNLPSKTRFKPTNSLVDFSSNRLNLKSDPGFRDD